MNDLLVERVCRAVEQVPPGRLVSYGDVAALVGTGPRVVGRVLAAYGAGVPWWRVTDRAGRLPPHLLPRAQEHWSVEGIGLRPQRDGASIARHRADLTRWAVAYAAAVADLDEAADGAEPGERHTAG